MFNVLDFLIIVMFLGIIGAGFFGGVTRVTAAIVALYFGAVFAGAFYDPLSEFSRDHLTTMTVQTGQLVFFLLLFIAFSAMMTVVISRWLSDVALPRRLQ